MKHISVLIPRGATVITCIEGSIMLFKRINDFLLAMGEKPAFKLHMVGLSHQAEVYDGVFSVQPDLTIDDDFETDLIIIPAVHGNMKEVIEANQSFFPWIIRNHRKGAEVASLCVGAFLLAATGLLKGKKCATHWMAANDFKTMFPDIQLVSEKIITDEEGIYSSGGANSFWNLLLYLIEKYTSHELAILASKYFEIDMDRSSQSFFIMFKGQKDHQDESIKLAQDFIEKNYQEKISIDQLSKMLAIGKRSLERRFKKATSNTITEYIQRVKMEAAKKAFETSRKNINEIMYEVGYADNKAFRSVFKKNTGLSPLDYKNKYNREIMGIRNAMAV